MSTPTQITLAWELHLEGVPKIHIALRLGRNRETVIRWIAGIESQGLSTFLDAYLDAKKGPRPKRQVDPLLKRKIWMLREREQDCCGQKIAYFLEKEHGVSVSVPKIYEILKERWVIRSRWKKNVRRGPIPTATRPREVIQMDTVDFGGIFAFTGIDIFTRAVDVLLTSTLTAQAGLRFLHQSMHRRFGGYVHLIQTDGGPEFKDVFLSNVRRFCDRHRVARPYRKNEQAFIESFNRSLRKECLGWGQHRPEDIPSFTGLVETFLLRYHTHRPHMGLGMKTPQECMDDCRFSTEN